MENDWQMTFCYKSEDNLEKKKLHNTWDEKSLEKSSESVYDSVKTAVGVGTDLKWRWKSLFLWASKDI